MGTFKKVNAFLMMDEAMMGNGRMGNLLAMELKSGKMVENMKVIGRMAFQ
jgi:hypothetical protein